MPKDKPEAQAVASKKDIASMVNTYAAKFNVPVRMTAETGEKEATFIRGELLKLQSLRLPAALSGGDTGRKKDGGPHYLQVSVRWLTVQIKEAWSL